jgi:hypothetical protein
MLSPDQGKDVNRRRGKVYAFRLYRYNLVATGSTAVGRTGKDLGTTRLM